MQLKKKGKSYYETMIMKTSPGHIVKVQNSVRKWENKNIYCICFICTKRH